MHALSSSNQRRAAAWVPYTEQPHLELRGGAVKHTFPVALHVKVRAILAALQGKET